MLCGGVTAVRKTGLVPRACQRVSFVLCGDVTACRKMGFMEVLALFRECSVVLMFMSELCLGPASLCMCCVTEPTSSPQLTSWLSSL